MQQLHEALLKSSHFYFLTVPLNVYVSLKLLGNKHIYSFTLVFSELTRQFTVKTMSSRFKKILPIIFITQILLMSVLVQSQNTATAEELKPVIKIVDANTNANGINLGNESEPMPPEGQPFTVNVTVDSVQALFAFQIGVSFDKSKIRCTGARLLAKDDPNYVFFNRTTQTVTPEIDNVKVGYVVLGASLVGKVGVTVSQKTFCQLNFTAIKTGTFMLNIIPTTDDSNNPYYGKDTFLWDPNLYYIPPDGKFGIQDFQVTVVASPSPPIPSFTTIPLNPKANETVTFDASGSFDPDGDIVSYYWDFGDGSSNITTTSLNVTHVFTLNGVYLVNLTVTDNDGNNGSILVEVPIGGIPQPSFTYDPSTPYRDDTVTFNATSSFDPDGNIVLYVWNFSRLELHAENTTITYVAVEVLNETTDNTTLTQVFATNALYNVKLTVFDNEGLSNSTMQEVFVGDRPVVDFTFSPEFPNPDEEVVFDATASYDDDGIIVYSVWDYGDGITEAFNLTEGKTLATIHVYVGQGGVYDVNLTLFDDEGLYSSLVKSVNVTVITKEKSYTAGWEGYATVGAIFGVILVAAVWYRRRPEKEPPRKDRYRVI